MAFDPHWLHYALCVSLLATWPSNARAQQGAALHELGVREAAELIRSGGVQAVDLVAHLLARIEDRESLHAVISVDRAGALAAARAVDDARERGAPLGPLAGVPLVIKDNIDTANLPTTGGTPALENHRPVRNAPVVQRLVNAGAIVLGKANLHELAVGITSANAHFGFVGNAYSPEHHAGGSSGGTGAAIGARLAPGGLGTDTGGSVRIPAALNGIAGLRPTIDRYPQDGMITLSRTRDTAGPMARTVDDLVLLDNVITGYDQPIGPCDLRTARIGVPESLWEDIEPETLALAEEVLDRLQERGVTVVELEIEDLSELVDQIAGPLTQYEIRRDLTRYLADSETGLDPAELVDRIASPDVKAILTTGAFGPQAPSAAEYRASIEIGRPMLQRAYFKAFIDHEIDALIFPTTVLPAGDFSELDEVQHNGRTLPAFPTYVRNAQPASLVGAPGLSIPMGLTTEGLPVGIELNGLPDSDRKLLALGLAIEASLEPLPPP